MPVCSTESSPGNRVLEYRCEGCGKPAMFGEGCNILEALRTGDVRRAGRWWCGWSAERGGYCRRNEMKGQDKWAH